MFARNLVVPLTAYSVVGCVGAPALAGQQERVLHHEVVIEAPLDVVWRAWTTVEGLRPISRASSRCDARSGLVEASLWRA